jgi:hypothetical protein
MKMKKLILVMSVCFLFVGITVAQVDVTGKWNMTTSSPRGERTRVAEFIQDGEALTVITEGREGGKVEAKGTVKGSDIEWTTRRETPNGTFEITYKGKIEGSTMTGTVQFGTRGSGEWTAKRVE